MLRTLQKIKDKNRGLEAWIFRVYIHSQVPSPCALRAAGLTEAPMCSRTGGRLRGLERQEQRIFSGSTRVSLPCAEGRLRDILKQALS